MTNSTVLDDTREPLKLPAFEKAVLFAVTQALETWRDEAMEGVLTRTCTLKMWRIHFGVVTFDRGCLLQGVQCIFNEVDLMSRHQPLQLTIEPTKQWRIITRRSSSRLVEFG